MAGDTDDKPKIGAGHWSAMGRQGLRELRGALYPDSNVAQQPEYGLYGTLTPGEIAADRNTVEHEQTPDQESHSSLITDRLQRAEERNPEPDRSDRERSLDR